MIRKKNIREFQISYLENFARINFREFHTKGDFAKLNFREFTSKRGGFFLQKLHGMTNSPFSARHTIT